MSSLVFPVLHDFNAIQPVQFKVNRFQQMARQTPHFFMI